MLNNSRWYIPTIQFCISHFTKDKWSFKCTKTQYSFLRPSSLTERPRSIIQTQWETQFFQDLAAKEEKKIKDHASSSRWIYISSYKLFYLLKSIFIFSFIFPTSYFLFCLMVTGDSNFPLPVSFWLLEMYFLVRLFALMCFSYFSSPVASAFSYYNPILFPHRSQIVLVCMFSVFL